jgi:hypothetical protein
LIKEEFVHAISSVRIMWWDTKVSRYNEVALSNVLTVVTDEPFKRIKLLVTTVSNVTILGKQLFDNGVVHCCPEMS